MVAPVALVLMVFGFEGVVNIGGHGMAAVTFGVIVEENILIFIHRAAVHVDADDFVLFDSCAHVLLVQMVDGVGALLQSF